MYFIDSNFRHIVFSNNSVITIYLKLGSVVGPVIQANGRLKFEDDLRSGGLLCFTTQSALGLPKVWSLRGNPGMARC